MTQLQQFMFELILAAEHADYSFQAQVLADMKPLGWK
jgi:hypothetical protein